jgi:hypothetical protein
MFGMLEAINGFLARMIGNRTDAADPNGSLHAKVSDAKNTINTVNNRVLPKMTSAGYSGSCGGTGSSVTTLVNLTGQGVVTGITITGSTSGSYSGCVGNFEVWVDGAKVYSFSCNASNNEKVNIGAAFYYKSSFQLKYTGGSCQSCSGACDSFSYSLNNSKE